MSTEELLVTLSNASKSIKKVRDNTTVADNIDLDDTVAEIEDTANLDDRE